MARYEVPPDPRDSELRPRRRRHQRGDRRDWVPFIGLLLGLIVTVAAIFIAFRIVTEFLDVEPLSVQNPIEPTVLILTAPATPVPTPTDEFVTPTPIATLTPVPTPDNADAPDSVQVGFYAEVANTSGVGLSVRGGPSTDNVKLLTVSEGTVGLVIGGPSEGSGFTWWQVQLDDGTEGWMAAQFLIPAEEPTQSEEVEN